MCFCQVKDLSESRQLEIFLEGTVLVFSYEVISRRGLRAILYEYFCQFT